MPHQSTPPIAWILVFGALLSAVAPGAGDAHEKHRRVAAPAADSLAQADSLRPAPPADSARPAPPARGTVEPFVLPPISRAWGEHLHNKIVHFPIVLALVSFVALFLARRNAGLLRFACALAWIAALSAAAAWISGLAQASAFDGEPKEWLVAIHRNAGIATTVSLGITALVTVWRRARAHAWKVALLGVMLVGLAGYLGGLLSHG